MGFSDDPTGPYVTNVTLYSADSDVEILRGFSAEVAASADGEPGPTIGTITGWVGDLLSPDQTYEEADVLGSDAEAPASIIPVIAPEVLADQVVIINRMTLDPVWRGQRRSGQLMDQLVRLLFGPHSLVLVVLQAEPQLPDGGPYPDGPQRDTALKRLEAAYQAAGLEQKPNSHYWWGTFPQDP